MKNKKQIFIEQVLKGGRFDESTPFLPHSILPDLWAYLEIVNAVAKELFLKNNPNKKRIPKGFDAKFNTGLVAIKSGSAVPVFERNYDQEDFIGDEFDQARDLINEQLLLLDGSSNQKPNSLGAFSEKIIPLFGHFGQHLKEGETITLKIPGQEKAPTYSKQTRSNILSINKKSYQDLCYLSGAISGFEVEKGVFYFTLGDKEPVSGPLSDTFDVTLRDLASRYRKEDVSANLIGIAKYNPDGSISQIERLQHIAIFRDGEPHYFPDFNKRFDELASYQDGWFDGKGTQFEKQDLQKVKEWISRLLQLVDIPAPFIYPSPDQQVIAEWSLGFWEVNFSFELAQNIISLHATHTASEATTEDRLPLNLEASLEKASKFLQNILSTHGK